MIFFVYEGLLSLFLRLKILIEGILSISHLSGLKDPNLLLRFFLIILHFKFVLQCLFRNWHGD